MSSNRFLLLNKELRKYKRTNKPVAPAKPVAVAKGHSSSRSYAATVVEDDVFVADVLSYFFSKRVNENQITDQLRDIAAKCLWEATKASRTTDLIPRPPKKMPTPAWLVSEAVQIAYRSLNNKGIYEAVKNTVTLKWRSAFESALIDAETSGAQSILTKEMSAVKTALVVFIENTGALPFQWDSKVGKFVQEGLEKVVDYIAEEFSKWLNKFADAKGKKYTEVIILEDAKATYTQLKTTLHELAKKEFIIDVFTLAHGNASSFSGYGGASISGSDLKALRDSFGQPLPLRVVYMMNCKGAGLNDEWIYAGARAVAGAVENNYIPEPMMSKFWNNWLRGDNFAASVNSAYADSCKLIKDTIAKAEQFIPFVGNKVKSMLEKEIDPLLADSKPKIEGNGSITIDTAKLAASQSLSLAAQLFSESKYDTGEHVLAGLVNESRITPTYELSVNGVKFTYGEIIAMGDFYESYAKMASASATELGKLKGFIDKSKRYFESKVNTGTGTGSNPTDDDWQRATSDRYLKLAEDNFAHFAPSNSGYISFSSSKANHKKEWERYHQMAIEEMRKGVNSTAADKALVINAFGDHFLTDAFAGGHLFNKDDLAQYFKSLVLTSGKINANGEKMFGAIADKAFTGKLKAEFSIHETVERKGGVWRPNIDSAGRFKALLIGIMEKEPDMIGKTMVAKIIHDELNKGIVPVTNGVGDSWTVAGDQYLDKKNVDIMRKAVKQSIRNLMDAVNDKSPYSVFFKKVWDITPRPTAAGVTVVKNTIRQFTNPLGTDIVTKAAALLDSKWPELLKELIKRGVLKRA